MLTAAHTHPAQSMTQGQIAYDLPFDQRKTLGQIDPLWHLTANGRRRFKGDNGMFITNIRIEDKSDNPSPLQCVMNAVSLSLDMSAFAWGLFTPYHWMSMAHKLNRSLARAWCAV